jgi:sulfur carrier protein
MPVPAAGVIWRYTAPATARYVEAAMRILFNDEPMKCEDGLTVAVLLDKLRQLKPGTALALNQQILPREQWEHQQVSEGDQILLFQVIAGG